MRIKVMIFMVVLLLVFFVYWRSQSSAPPRMPLPQEGTSESVTSATNPEQSKTNVSKSSTPASQHENTVKPAPKETVSDHSAVGSAQWFSWLQTLSPKEQSEVLTAIERSMYP